MREACGLVLAGGRSTRFGSDKALAQFRGAPLLAHVLRGLSAAGFAQIALAAKDPARYATVVEEHARVTSARVELLQDGSLAAIGSGEGMHGGDGFCAEHFGRRFGD